MVRSVTTRVIAIGVRIGGVWTWRITAAPEPPPTPQPAENGVRVLH